jgi:hypothetical protein
MPYDSMDGYAYLDPEDNDQLRELFLTQEVRGHLAKRYPDELAEAEQQYLKGVRELLRIFQDDPKNASDGGVLAGELHVRIPGTDRYFFSIKQTLLSLAVTVVPAAAVTLLVSPILLLKLAPATVSAGKAVWDSAAVLSDSDLDVYTAVVRSIERNRSVMLGPRGATKTGIEESFRLDPKLARPDNLDDKLASLCQRNVLKKDTTRSETEYGKGI